MLLDAEGPSKLFSCLGQDACNACSAVFVLEWKCQGVVALVGMRRAKGLDQDSMCLTSIWSPSILATIGE